ncbi:MAG TPA: hypothetical protein VKV26_03330 [Dehalococcoidia bacterium]|nr:hypothetical protein [Dehalococcoidia bacterium]
MSEQPPRPPLSQATLAEAIAAFDAGNHAWGRFRHFVLPTAPAALAVSTASVREALSEAAICVPDTRPGEHQALLAALRQTRERLDAYAAALPAAVPRTELDQAAEDFGEAIALLEGQGAA